MTFPIVLWLGGIIGFAITLRFDVRRRKLSLTRTAGWNLLTLLDVICVAFAVGLASVLLIASPQIQPAPGRLLSPATFEIVARIAALFFLWTEGRRQVQIQRPAGIVFAEWAILFGLYQLATKFLFPKVTASATLWDSIQSIPTIVVAIAIGGAVLTLIIPPFVQGHEQHRILDRIAAQGEFVQTEATVSTPECPHPERWQMVDAQSAEIEVLDFLKSLVITVT